MDDQIKKGEIRCCLEGETQEEVGDVHVGCDHVEAEACSACVPVHGLGRGVDLYLSTDIKPYNMKCVQLHNYIVISRVA